MTTSLVAITGNTFPVKDQLKAMGARWNADSKAWMVAADKADAARALVSGAPKQPYTGPRSTGHRPGTCSHCGERCNPRFRTCVECAHGGQSYRDRNGNFVLGSDD